jgi:MoxR-like ATPase
LVDEIKPIQIQPIKHEDYIPSMTKCYVPQGSELDILDIHLKHGKNILLEGPHGIGKTLAIAYQAAKNKIPLIQMDCSENTKRHDLIGRFVLVGNDVSYQLGFMPTAFELANKYGFAVACLEELNALNPNMQKVLNQMLDWRNHCYVPEIHKIFQLREGAKLMICGTMNPSTYGGVFELNQDMKSRFLTMKIGFPKEAKEKEIVQSQVTIGNMSLLQQLETIAIESRNGVSKGTFSYAISTRDIISTIEAYNMYPDTLKAEAIRLGILNKFDEEQERKTMIERIRAIMGLQL